MEHNHANFIWNIAESLRGPFKPAEYGSVVLPFTILRRLDAVLEPTKDAVLRASTTVGGLPDAVKHFTLTQAAKQGFYNTSRFTFRSLLDDAAGLRANLSEYIGGFSPNVRDIFEKFKFEETLNKLDEKNKLLPVMQRFGAADFHPDRVSNIQMGLVFEELIRWANERTNETAGDHYTPREVIALMVQLLLEADDEALHKPGAVRSIYDPTAGTGGMLSVADEQLRAMNPAIELSLYGQDINPQSYAVCKADMVIKGQAADNIREGDTLTEDHFPDRRFDYLLSNPPFGVDWKDQRAAVEDEHARLGLAGRFGAGTPAVSDGAMLFLQHLVAKMRRPEEGGARAAIVLNGSPLFAGGAGSGESNIRKSLLERDLVEAIIALPKDMFYNTGISTYIWVLSNRKSAARQGKVQLINATGLFRKMRKGMGSKRNELGPTDIADIVKLYTEFGESKLSKVFANEVFFYRTITIERPLRLNFAATAARIDAVFDAKAVQKLDEGAQGALRAALETLDETTVWTNREAFSKALDTALREAGVKLATPVKKAVIQALGEPDDSADICTGPKNAVETDASLRDTENVPWNEDIHEYFDREVKPYAPDAWIDETKTKVGAEIPFTRHFYEYVPPRDLADIDRDLEMVFGRLREMLSVVEQ